MIEVKNLGTRLNTLKSFSSFLGIGINVKHFGAKGDGITDDTAAINAAIQASGWPTNPTKIIFPKGKYLITSTITVDAGGALSTPDIVFDGQGSIIQTVTNGINLFTVTNSVVSLCGAKFNSITFAPNSTSSRAVLVNNAQHCDFYNCRFTSNFACGVEFTGNCSYNKFINCTFDNLSRGIYSNGNSSFISILGCSFGEQLAGNPLNWIELNGGRGIVIGNSTFYGSGATLPNIRVLTSTDVAINACVFDSLSNTAIQLGGYGNADNNIVSGCHFINIGMHGVHVYGGVRNNISNCNFLSVSKTTAKAYDAIAIEQRYSNGGGSSNIITGNVCNDKVNTRYLVNEIGGANYNIVSNNIATPETGFNVLGANSLNTNNILH